MARSEFANGSIARRAFLRQAGVTGLVVAGVSILGGLPGVAGAGVLTAPAPNDAPADPDAALARLMRGNRRFVRGRPKNPVDSDERRRASVGNQTPFAAILACADSRVPPEIIFDQGLGDLFVVRVAGNIPGSDEIASLAYAAEHVGVDLILVVGHEGCGAVKTTIEVIDGNLDPGEYAPLTQAITPAVEAARGSGASGADLLPASVEANVRLVTTQIPDRSPAIATEIERRKIAVVGSIYDLETGKVTLV
jgi:carbonic anhydrase